MARVVYISYDGMAEQLGQSQVLPYVRGLGKRGHQIELLSFEKPPEPLVFRRPIAEGVRWTSLRYHRTPTVPATSFDLVQGQATLALLDALAGGVDLLHVRSYVPCLMALAWSKLRRVPLLFDTRGTWPDQKVAAGTWSATGRLYRGTKRVERTLYARADYITVLTNAYAEYLRRDYPHAAEVRAPIAVIPTCVDLDTFSVEGPATLRDETCRTLVYVGSLGGVYLDEAIGRFYLAFRRRVGKARLLVVSKQAPTAIAAVLGDAAGELVHRGARHDEVPGYLRSADAAVSLIGEGFGFLGSAPTKLGEMLACGLPVAATPLGDVVNLLDQSGAGVVVRDVGQAGIEAAAEELVRLMNERTTRATARRLAERWFSLARAVDAYDEIYHSIVEGGALSGNWPDQRWPTDRWPTDR